MHVCFMALELTILCGIGGSLVNGTSEYIARGMLSLIIKRLLGGASAFMSLPVWLESFKATLNQDQQAEKNQWN